MGLDKPHQSANFEVAIFSRCRNITGKPLNLGSFPTPGQGLFFSECDFIMGLGKPKLHTKFEVASLSCCRNINGKLQNFGQLP